MANIDHSNVPRFLDGVPISDISTGDRAAMILEEFYKNLSGHVERVYATLVTNPGPSATPTAVADLKFMVPMFLKDYGYVDDADDSSDTDVGYYTPMQSLVTKMAECALILRKILEKAQGNS